MRDVVWWEIETPAPERFQEFHGRLWGWTFEAAFAGTELDADYWLIKSVDTSIGGLQRSATSTPPHAGVRLYLEADNLEATLARVTALGGQVERHRVALGGADRWFAVIRDPSGVSFGLWTPNPATT
jgi:predicted enzyme related to lactoylglutathione lyase